jgi:Na+-translocating ferredoxin:NAD+ oxidoreductase RnfG subunit
MNLKVTFILIILTLLSSFGLPKQLHKKVDKEIKATFNLEKYSLNSFAISQEIIKELPAQFNGDNFFEIVTNDTIVGYAYVSKAESKTDLFDYLVLIDPELTIKKSRVLVYREDYGGEIGSRRWLKQFIGKTKHDELRYGDNIMAISGATISVKSMTNAVNNFLMSLRILNSKHIL